MSIRAGVAGIGVFGQYHADKYEQADGATLTALYDTDPVNLSAQATKRGIVGFEDYDAFLASVDAVTIATPASSHGPLAEAAIRAGKSVLVEKPIALDCMQAVRMVQTAEEKNLVLQIGHQERYVASEFGLFADAFKPHHIASRRLNRYSGRAMDVSVVFDLMIHDLDLLLQYNPGELRDLAVNARHIHGNKADYIQVDMLFSSGLTASLEAGRIAENPIRDLTLALEAGSIGFDFLNRTITNESGFELSHSFDSEIPAPAAVRDPLLWGTQSFLDSIRFDRTPEVSGQDGLDALRLALKIEAQIDAVAR